MGAVAVHPSPPPATGMGGTELHKVTVRSGTGRLGCVRRAALPNTHPCLDWGAGLVLTIYLGTKLSFCCE